MRALEADARLRQFREEKCKGFVLLPDPMLARKRLATLTSLLSPHKADGFSKVRIGSAHDGGYVCLDDFRDIDAALSFGVGRNVDWNREVADKGIPIYQYDHTVEGPPIQHPRFHFHRLRLGTQLDGGESIEAIVTRHGLVRPASSILKIDIEHAEWDVFDKTQDRTLSLFSQIVGEFHGFDEILNDAWFATAERVFTKLAKQFRLVHVHGNNFGAQVVMGNVLFPRCIGLTFANASRYVLSANNEEFPGALDTPNSRQIPDCFLGRFNYDL